MAMRRIYDGDVNADMMMAGCQLAKRVAKNANSAIEYKASPWL